MRIGILCHAGCGGSGRIATELGWALAARGHDVNVFARREPFGVRTSAEGLRVWGLHTGGMSAWDRLDDRWPARDFEAMVRSIIGVVDVDGLDVLHFHYAVPFAEVVGEVRRRLGRRCPRLVGTLHGTDVSIKAADPRAGPRLRAALPALDVLTTVSQAHASLARTNLFLEKEPLVIPNFVDLQRFQPRQMPETPARRPRIVYASNFRTVKDPQAAARIFISLRRRRDAELWLVGDGAEMRATRRLLRRAGVDGDVRFMGLRRDVEQILPLADLLLVTSRNESFCLTALEAMASALPVVATRVGGLPELVVDGHTGFLVDPGDIDGAVRAVCELLEDDALRSGMGRAAYDRARLYSPDRVVPRYETLYAGLLETQAVPVGAGVRAPKEPVS